ncbi:MAG: diguanylate cyclase domain-containing protein, partial [Nitrososphaerales archaeon]
MDVTDAAVGSVSIDEALQTALDLCLGLGAFVVSMTGVVHRVLSDAMPPEDGWRRIEVLARNCLSHPAAGGRDLFWNAEVSTEAGSADRSLACVVVPIWSLGEEIGLLGVVDTWLPEPDESQRAGLARLAADLARLVGSAGGTRGATPAVHQPGLTETIPSSTPPAPPPRRSDATVRIDAAELIAGFEDGIMCVDTGNTVVLSNRSADAMHGLAPDRTLLGSPLPLTSALSTEDGQALAPDRHPAVLALQDGLPHHANLTIGEEGDGLRHVTVSARPFPIEGRQGALVVLHDTTTEWIEQQRLTQYALYDPLTGLANRYLLAEELRRMLLGLGRRGGSVALIYMDLDLFKRVNDEHGHDMGDEV